MKPTKPISEWRNVFLDTSVIVDFLQKPEKFLKNPLVQQRIEFVHKIMTMLGAKEKSRVIRRFYISAITVGELKNLQRPHSTKDIISIFNGADVMFVDYTKDIAIQMNNSLEKNLSSAQLTQWLDKQVRDFGSNSDVSARKWMSDDMKIIASAKAIKNVDVILTSDHKTFKPIADRLEVPCLTMKQEEFPCDIFGEINEFNYF